MAAMKVLVTGWFSFVHGEATAGDLLARDVACGWECGERGTHDATHSTILEVLRARRLCVVPFDTRVDPRPEQFPGAFRSPDEVETLVARMDVVVTTRLHGMVHALKQGVPAVAVDPISGGAKIRHQAEAVGWPVVLTPDELSEESLNEALDYCLTPEAQIAARSHARQAAGLLRKTRAEFVDAMRDGHR